MAQIIPNSQIPGWGIDADPADRPTYPMRDESMDDHSGTNWVRPPLQPAQVEILHSNERPSLSAVFGTPCPPSGLSGKMRRWAFRYSEGRWAHWLILMAADRVNVIEGIIDDLRRGHIPNIPAEMGLRAEWRYNRKGLIKKAATMGFISFVVVGGIIALARS